MIYSIIIADLTGPTNLPEPLVCIFIYIADSTGMYIYINMHIYADLTGPTNLPEPDDPFNLVLDPLNLVHPVASGPLRI